MTAALRRQGLAAIVVGRDGRGYDVPDWPSSRTFRLGEQENLLLSDNQSRNFAALPAGARATYRRMSWGDYLGPAPHDFPDLGFAFGAKRRLGRGSAPGLSTGLATGRVESGRDTRMRLMLASPRAPRRGALLASMIALIAEARSLLRRKLQKPEDQAPRLGARDDPGENRQTEKPKVDFVSNDACVSHAPSPQATIDILDGWVSILPAELGADTRGSAPLFADERAIWAIDRLGGVRGATILELGPLEGGHTYMLDRAGAKSIIAIEGNKRCYLKCLITKELLGG